MFICSLWTRLSKTKGFFYVTDLIFGGFGKNYKYLPPFLFDLVCVKVSLAANMAWCLRVEPSLRVADPHC